MFLWNFCVGLFEWIVGFIKEWFTQASEAGFSPSIGALFLITVICLIIIASAMAAMTVAEVKNRNRPLHFVLGALLPLIYPALLHFVLPEFKIKTKEERDLEALVDSMGAADMELPDSELKKVTDADEKGETPVFSAGTEIEITPQYLSKIMTDETGNPTGPYMLEMMDGKILEISKITNVLDKVIAVEMGEPGEDTKTIRLPYANIKTFTLKEKWLEEVAVDEDYDENEEISEGEQKQDV